MSRHIEKRPTSGRRPQRLLAGGTALAVSFGLLTATATAPTALAAPIGQGFTISASDLAFILDQIQIAEAHATTETQAWSSPIGNGPNDIPDPLLPWGIRQVDGRNNNLFAGREEWGAADASFPRLVAQQRWDRPDGAGGTVSYPSSNTSPPDGIAVADASPRRISNLIADQSVGNPAAVAAAGPGAVPEPDGSLFIPNRAPDVGLSAPFNSMFTLFGQFFDHGLDLVAKSATEAVVVPLQPDDPLYVPGAPTNFMVLNRTVLGAGGSGSNSTTPYVDQNQTYTSHPSHQVFLREYESSPGGPVATGHLIDGAIAGNIANWGEVKDQAASMLGIELTDLDVLNVPLLLTDEYGRFLRGPNGLPQLVLQGGGVLEGNLGSPVSTANAERSGHAFLDDIAHNAGPVGQGGPRTPDANSSIGSTTATLPAGTYDDELLAAHFITGDGRGNENIGLTAVHTVFHSEHNRVATDIHTMLQDPALVALKNGYEAAGAWGYGDRLFQAARFVTEMEYQHLVFEEFARKIQPAIRAFAAYDPTLNPDISAEFAHAVYRFGHSMLTERVDRVNSDGSRNDVALLDAFLNPVMFNDDGQGGTLTAADAAGSIAQGMTAQVGNEIDEFVTGALRNRLLGLPLDLATLNLARGRDTGTATLNQARAAFFAETGNPALAPYANWVEFGLALRHPGSIVNFVAAYGLHPSITGADTVADKRAAAQVIVDNANAADPAALEFMSSGATGVDDVDLWVGGLAEAQEPFGGMLGTTFNHVFQSQLEHLQEGDRFYYLDRTAGMNLLAQLEGNSLSEMIMRNTSAENLPADVFSRAGHRFDLRRTGNFCQFVQDDPATPEDESQLLTKAGDGTVAYAGEEHVVLGGTEFDDRIRAGLGDDTVHGNDGNDVVQGGVGNDTLVGGDGDDRLLDSQGIDVLKAGRGHDVLSSGAGLDLNQAGTGDDFVLGGPDGTETLSGPGDDRVIAGGNADIVLGDSGDDWIEGGASGDGLEGDSGAPLGVDIDEPGHDVLIGDNGVDDTVGEGGGDVNVAGSPSGDRFDGGFGFDWEVLRGSSETDIDLGRTFIVPPNAPPVDRYQAVEGASGWNGADTIVGDDADALALAADPAIPNSSNELSAADLTRIQGLGALVGTAPANGTDGNVLLGGSGGDQITGRGGNDLIDGDAWLNVQLRVPNLGTAAPDDTILVDSLTSTTGSTTVRQALLDGLINPADLRTVRTVQRSAPAGGADVAVYYGAPADYAVEIVDGSTVLVTDNRVVPVFGVNEGVDRVRGVEVLRFENRDAAGVPQAPVDIAVSAIYAGGVVAPVVIGAPSPQAPLPALPGAGAASITPTNNSLPRGACTSDSPSAPRSVVATAGVGSATVTWTAPQYAGAAGVQRYVMEMTDAPQVQPGDPVPTWTLVSSDATSPATVSGLAANDTVQFRVAAVSGGVRGPWAVSGVTAAAEPPQPPAPPADPGTGGGSTPDAPPATGGSGSGGSGSSGGSSVGGSGVTPPVGEPAAAVTVSFAAREMAVTRGSLVTFRGRSSAAAGTPVSLLRNGKVIAESTVSAAGDVVFAKIKARKGGYVMRVGNPGSYITSGRLAVTVKAFRITRFINRPGSSQDVIRVATGAWEAGTTVALIRGRQVVTKAAVASVGEPITFRLRARPGRYNVRVSSDAGVVLGSRQVVIRR